jgi:hypothetical protein
MKVQLIPSTTGRPLLVLVRRNSIRWALRLPRWCAWLASSRSSR